MLPVGSFSRGATLGSSLISLGAMVEKLDTQQMMLAAMIALLRRDFPAIRIKEQLAIGMKIAKQVMVEADIAKTGGDSFIIEGMEGQVTINAQNVGVYLQPEWAAKEGIDKTIFSNALDLNYGETLTDDTVVTAGKTLYITSATYSQYASAEADGDKNQMGHMLIEDYGIETLAALGGNGGDGQSFPKPLSFASGHTLRVRVYNWANHKCNVAVTLWGYEA